MRKRTLVVILDPDFTHEPNTQFAGPFDSNQTMDGEHAFLFFLRGITSTATVNELIKEFGDEKTTWSRCFWWLVRRCASASSGLRRGGPVLSFYLLKGQTQVQLEDAAHGALLLPRATSELLQLSVPRQDLGSLRRGASQPGGVPPRLVDGSSALLVHMGNVNIYCL